MCNICMFPRSTVHLYGIIPVPAAVLGVGFIASDVFGLSHGVNTGVGYAGHLGGALCGVLAFGLWRTGRWPRMLMKNL